MTPTTTDIDDFVSLERGEVDRRIYSDRRSETWMMASSGPAHYRVAGAA